VQSRPWADRVPDTALWWASAGLAVAGGVCLLVGWLVGKIEAWPYRHNTSRRLSDAEAAEYQARRAARATETVTVQPMTLVIDEGHQALPRSAGRPGPAVELVEQLILQGRKAGLAIEAPEAVPGPAQRRAALQVLGVLLAAELADGRDLRELNDADVDQVVDGLAVQVALPRRTVWELTHVAVRICRAELGAAEGPVDREHVERMLTRCWALLMHGSLARREADHA
jgi:hypothetical protein